MAMCLCDGLVSRLYIISHPITFEDRLYPSFDNSKEKWVDVWYFKYENNTT